MNCTSRHGDLIDASRIRKSRWKAGGLDEKPVERLAKPIDAAPIAAARPRDKGVEQILECRQLLNSRDRQSGIGIVKGVCRQLVFLGIGPKGIEIPPRAFGRIAFAIAPDVIEVVTE